VALILLIGAVNFLTEITSNLATTAMLLPVLAPLALEIGVHPFGLMVGAAVAASCAFMLPVATPPNAVVFGAGYLRIPDMVSRGLALNLISICIIAIAVYLLLPLLWEIDLQQFPDQFRGASKN
jgi:sodium-dependent dicarboxylate transporter 2/3/5